MKHIYFFNDPIANEPDLVGEKGSLLAEMTRAGFPVPSGFCLTVDAYRYLIEVTGLEPIITRMLAAIEFQDTAGVEEKAARIRELIIQQPIPQRVADEIASAWIQLAGSTESSPSQFSPVAVRFSAVAVDYARISCADQHDSFLNIADQSSLLQQIRRCWASLWTTRAITFRQQQGIDQQHVLPAVIVQMMVDPHASGVVFTANPINGSRAKCLIKASWGLGDAASSTDVAVDAYVVQKVNGRISKKQIACKEWMIKPDPPGGTIESATAVQRPHMPILSERQVAELTALATRIEEYFGEPQEISWAYDGSHWHILQCRRVTPLSAFKSPAAIPNSYIQPMFVEILSQETSPNLLRHYSSSDRLRTARRAAQKIAHQ